MENRSKSSKSTLPRLGVDGLPVLQQGLPDALLPGVAMINVSRIAHDLLRRSPIGRREWLIPRGKDIVVRDEWAGVLRGDVTTRKINF
jgi:hypothetical protein